MLIKCHNCNSDYSEYAKSCPKCGNKNTNTRRIEKGCYSIANRKNIFLMIQMKKQKRTKYI